MIAVASGMVRMVLKPLSESGERCTLICTRLSKGFVQLMMTLPNGQEVAMGEVLRLQFEDGMDWLAGTFEREDVDGSRPWLSEAPAEIQLTIEVAPISERLSGLTVERFDPDPRDFMP